MKYIGPSNVWECSERIYREFCDRCVGPAELTCNRQIAQLVKQYAQPGDTLLDAACGTGHFYKSLQIHDVPVDYYGIDKSRLYIEGGRKRLVEKGLPPSHLMVGDFIDTPYSYHHVVCINTLCFLPHYHPYLDRLCRVAEKTLIIRTSLAEKTDIRYVVDGYLDEPYNTLKLNFNTYSLAEVTAFIAQYGFDVQHVKDEYTQDKEEIVAGKKMYRKILCCVKKS